MQQQPTTKTHKPKQEIPSPSSINLIPRTVFRPIYAVRARGIVRGARHLGELLFNAPAPRLKKASQGVKKHLQREPLIRSEKR